ncbi:MAG: lamin tail domain-containing protein, partial [Anaerolineae bacterium]
GYILGAGASVRIHSGRDAVDNPPTDLLWIRRSIWNNSGDRADLLNAEGHLVDTYSYGECAP